MRALTAIVLGVLGAGCGGTTYDSVARKAGNFVSHEMVYVYDAVTCPERAVQEACRERFPEFATRAVRVRGLNKEEEMNSVDVCCIVEREVYEHFYGNNVFIRAGYCTKMGNQKAAKAAYGGK